MKFIQPTIQPYEILQKKYTLIFNLIFEFLSLFHTEIPVLFNLTFEFLGGKAGVFIGPHSTSTNQLILLMSLSIGSEFVLGCIVGCRHSVWMILVGSNREFKELGLSMRAGKLHKGELHVTWAWRWSQKSARNVPPTRCAKPGPVRSAAAPKAPLEVCKRQDKSS